MKVGLDPLGGESGSAAAGKNVERCWVRRGPPIRDGDDGAGLALGIAETEQ